MGGGSAWSRPPQGSGTVADAGWKFAGTDADYDRRTAGKLTGHRGFARLRGVISAGELSAW